MKKIFCLFLAAVMILSLSSCFRFKDDEMPTFSGSFTGKVTDISGDSLLLVSWDDKDKSTDGGLYIAYSGSTDKISTGSIVNVGYSGMMLETFPAQLGGVKKIDAIGQSDNITGFFVSLFGDLWDEDTSLNDGVTVLAFDFSQCDNLTEGEKSAVMYLCALRLNVPEVVSGTIDELISEGWIDGDRQYFENGVLFSVENIVYEDEEFSFSATKWRSRQDSASYRDCHAKLNGTEWDYSCNS